MSEHPDLPPEVVDQLGRMLAEDLEAFENRHADDQPTEVAS